MKFPAIVSCSASERIFIITKLLLLTIAAFGVYYIVVPNVVSAGGCCGIGSVDVSTQKECSTRTYAPYNAYCKSSPETLAGPCVQDIVQPGLCSTSHFEYYTSCTVNTAPTPDTCVPTGRQSVYATNGCRTNCDCPAAQVCGSSNCCQVGQACISGTCTWCGNGYCGSGENCTNCPADCGCTGALTCQSGVCACPSGLANCPVGSDKCCADPTKICSAAGVCIFPPTAVCGNNIKEGAEACDDGNTINEVWCPCGETSCANTCNSTCTAPIIRSTRYCGDGVVNSGTCGEACDLGLAGNGDCLTSNCSTSCTLNPNPTVDIKANGSDGPITVTAGSTASVSWTSSCVNSCSTSCSNNPATIWTLLNTTRTTQPINSTTICSSNCSGRRSPPVTGALLTASDSVTINVPAPLATVSITANGSHGPIVVSAGSTVSVVWTSTNATSCSVSCSPQPGTTWTSLNSTQAIQINSNTSCSATCYNSDNVSASDSVTINLLIPNCGNSSIESPETCDDGNTITEACTYGLMSCTVCNNVCQSVPGATSYCGDGTKNGPEGCDLGAVNNGVCPKTCSVTCTINPCVNVTLTADPPSGTAPLNGVDLRATVGGTAVGTINYKFYCNLNDSSTWTLAIPKLRVDGSSLNPYQAVDVCNGEYLMAGTYYPKVIVERDGAPAAENHIPLVVSGRCGNGTTETGETCDDGNTTTEACTYGLMSCTVCNNVCQSVSGATSYCGDGTKNGPEGCEPPNTATCDDRCQTITPPTGPVVITGVHRPGTECYDITWNISDHNPLNCVWSAVPVVSGWGPGVNPLNYCPDTTTTFNLVCDGIQATPYTAYVSFIEEINPGEASFNIFDFFRGLMPGFITKTYAR